MDKAPDFDLAAAHRFFSAHCFNQAWEFIDKSRRSPADTDAMLEAAHASAWHWRQRPDFTNEKRSISYWQLSRVYALTGEAHRSMRYARLCLEASQGQSPFLTGYAYEALARAAALAGDAASAGKWLNEAWALLSRVQDAEDRELLRKDLESLSRENQSAV